MIAYATVTGTKRNLKALKSHGWRLLFTPDSQASHMRRAIEAGFSFCLDNGAWSAFQQEEPWDGDGFLKLLKGYGDRADFVVVPDIVEGGKGSLERSSAWLPACLRWCKGDALVPVQDGMAPWDVEPLLHSDNRIGIFVGGSTEGKLASMPWWGRLAKKHGRWLHVGRVNSVRRINACLSAGADSFDGSACSKRAKYVRRLDGARHQVTLFKLFDEDAAE